MIDDSGAGARVLDANTKTTERGGGGYRQRDTSCFGDLLRTPTSARFIEKRSSLFVLFEKKRFEGTNNVVSPCLGRMEEIERSDRTYGLIIFFF